MEQTMMQNDIEKAALISRGSLLRCAGALPE